MRTGVRQSMAWLHGWSGLVVGWVFFCVFVTGTASYYRADISHWMRPEQRERVVATTPEALGQAAEVAVAHLKAAAPTAIAWYITLPHAGEPMLDLAWMTSLDAPYGHAKLDPATGAEPATRATRGGDFLYAFHFELGLPPMVGRWIVGACAMVVLVAMLSGIVTHRRIVSDFFTFRRDRSAQRGWLDAHNMTGVLALPFHLMIVYTGVVTMALMYMPWGMRTAYGGDELRLYAEARLMPAYRMPVGRPGTLAPVAPMVAKAVGLSPEALEMLIVNNPGDAAATVSAVFEEGHGLSHVHPQVGFDGATGAVTDTLLDPPKPATLTHAAMMGLHMAHFAGPALRVLFFLCGVLGSATVATGLVLWSVARLPRTGEARPFSLRLVQTLNVGTVAGLPAAIAAYFLANRLLPVDLAARAEWEVGAFFAVWLMAALAPIALSHRQAWQAVLGAAAALFLAVPMANAVTTGRHGLGGDPLFFWFDAAMLALAALLAFGAAKAGRAVAARERRTHRPARGAPALNRA